MSVRKYDVARGLLSSAGSMDPQLAQMVQGIKVAPAYKLGRAPRDLANELFLTVVKADYASPAIPETLAALVRREAAQFSEAIAPLRVIGGWFLDDALALVTVKTEGRPDGPWKLTVDMQGKTFIAYAALDGGQLKVIGLDEAPAGVGRHALALLAKRQLLDWVYGQLATRRTPRRIVKLWDPSQTNDVAAAELAAALLAAGSDAELAIPILTRCPTSLADGRALCDAALGATLMTTRHWKELEAHAQVWLQHDPASATLATDARIHALVALKRGADAQRVLDDALATSPSEVRLLELRPVVAVARSDFDAAIKAYDDVIQSPGGTLMDKNNAAWLRAARGRDLPLALEYARAAVRDVPHDDTALNTLAVVETELGDLGPAREHGLQSMKLRIRARPDGQDLYFVGRLLEQLGLRDDAIAAYKAIKRAREDELESSYALGRGRLKQLGAKP